MSSLHVVLRHTLRHLHLTSFPGSLLYPSLYFTFRLRLTHFPHLPIYPDILPGWEFQRSRLSNPTPRELLVGSHAGCLRGVVASPSLPLLLTSLALLSPELHCSKLAFSSLSFPSIIFFSRLSQPSVIHRRVNSWKIGFRLVT